MHFSPVNILGLMSGTSLDGLDLCLVQFEGSGGLNWKILKAETRPYDAKLVMKLKNAHLNSDKEIQLLDQDVGERFAKDCEEFLEELHVDLVASHGHTIKHRPDLGYTLQIGDSKAIQTKLKCPVIYDFRTQDIELGGQGAPLVPIGDELLFGEYDFCLNIGGFANFSTRVDSKRIAADICPVNVVLNTLAEKLGRSYDDKGLIARVGNVDYDALEKLNELGFYSASLPKSLGREWVDREIWPILKSAELIEEDALATFTEHAAIQIAKMVSHGRALFTGGGVKNEFLIERIREHSTAQIEIPSPQLVDFKEALVFALLGLLRVHSQINVLASVTGAKQDHISGQILGDYYVKKEG